MIDELAIRLKARQFMAGLDLSNIDKDLTVYTRKVNAKLTTEEKRIISRASTLSWSFL